MYPAAFDYATPASVAEAATLLRQQEGDAKIVAGGHSLIPAMKLRLSTPPTLIDLRNIADLVGISSSGSAVLIGARTTHSMLEDSALLKQLCPLLPETASEIGDQQVRNRGTIGGSIAHADPAADLPAAILAVDATMTAVNASGTRTIAATDFFVDILTTALQPDEILTSISVPLSPAHTGMAYAKFRHPASGYAVVGVAAVVTLDASGLCASVRVGVTGAGSRAYRASGVEAALLGQRLTDDTIAAASAHVGDGVDFMSDIHASEEYRAHLLGVYTRRALARAAARAAA